jgi:histone-binding protein RBBP4
LTVESLPDAKLSSDGNEIDVNFLLGTYKVDGGNALEAASFRLPSTLSPTSEKPVPIENGPSLFPKFKINQTWKHPGEVNKARYNKFNDKIATFTNSGDIKIYKFDSAEELHTLKFHKKDGFGLEWGHGNELLLTGGEDLTVALWDLSKNTSTPTRTYQNNTAIVNDLSWSYGIPTLFGSVSDDLSIQLIDIRSDSSDPLLQIQKGHNDVINAIEFNAVQPNLFVTGSADNLVHVWDLRYLDKPLRKLYGHNNAITNLKFNPEQGNLLASASQDRRIHIWDLNKINESFVEDDYLKNDIEDPTLVFIHGGHSATITEFDWVSGAVNTIISAGEDSLIQVWKPRLEEEEEEEEQEEQEKHEDEKKEE